MQNVVEATVSVYFGVYVWYDVVYSLLREGQSDKDGFGGLTFGASSAA